MVNYKIRCPHCKNAYDPGRHNIKYKCIYCGKDIMLYQPVVLSYEEKNGRTN